MVLHVDVAAQCYQRDVIGWAFERVRLESDKSARHAVARVAEDGHASPQLLALPSPLHLNTVLIHEDHDMVEPMATYLAFA